MARMLRKLSTYYQQKGISPLDFRCGHWQACRRGNPHITQAKGAFVGTGYEKGILPRLLFLSLDPGDSDSDPNRRTGEFLRHFEEKECTVDDLPKQRHWYRTHELAYTLLKRFRPRMSLQDSHLYFAHTNSVKCSVNNSNHKQANPRLFTNCREYVGGELLILKPEILITQGKQAKIAVERSFEVSHSFKGEPCSYKWAHIGGGQTIWFHTFHPSNYGKFNQQRRECFEDWAKIVYRSFRKKIKGFGRM
jgi:uracil-DNA glycosylase family 4